MTKWINKIFRSQVASSIIYTVLGIWLIVMPEKSMDAICMLFGGGMVILGLIHVGAYIKHKEKGFILDLLSGALQLVLGGFLLLNPQVIQRILPILLGAVILVDSIWSFQACFEMKRLNFVRWNWLFGATVIFVILGIVMIVNPFKALEVMMIFIGIVYLLNGLSDIFFLFFLKQKDKIVNKMAENMVMDMNKAKKAGNVIDAEVNAKGKVVEESVEYQNVSQAGKNFADMENEVIIDVEPEDIVVKPHKER